MDDSIPPQVNEQSLYQMVLELEQSERRYHEQLNYLSDLYILPLKTCVISGEEIEKMLLSKIKDMIDISAALSTQIAARLQDWDDEQSQIGDIFLENAHLWDLYSFFSHNLESAIGTYEEKMMSADFAALVTIKQGMDNVSLKHLILSPIERLKTYKKFFNTFLDKHVAVSYMFGYPWFSDVMECAKKVTSMIPPNYETLCTRKQVEEYRRIEAMLGDQWGPEFSSFIKHVHEEPESSKRWKKRSYKKTPNKLIPKQSPAPVPEPPGPGPGSESIEIGGKKYTEDAIAPEILNAFRKDEDTQVMVGMVPPKPSSLPSSETSSPDNYVCSEEKVKVRWENEVHNYTLLLFRQCLIFSKVKGRSMKISRIIKLRNMWIADFNSNIGFGQVEKQDCTCMGGWVGSDGGEDEDVLHRVVLQFSSPHTRTYWFTLVQRYIKQCRARVPITTGTIKVYFKGSDSKLSLPCDSIWEGMSCQDIQIDLSLKVDEVIKQAVTSCQMIDTKYTLTFLLLQDTKILMEESLVGEEIPLVIQNSTRLMFSEQKTIQPIFILRHLNYSVGQLAPSGQRASTLTQFFRRGGRGTFPPFSARTPTSHGLQVATATSNKMFNLPLSKFMSTAPEGQDMPAALLDLLIYIYTNCFDTEGIFRKPGARAVQRQFEDRLDSGQLVDWTTEQMNARCYLPNVAVSLLKNYFRSLPNGLFPKSLFPEFERWRSAGCQLEDMVTILAKIPDYNMIIIRYLLHVLKRIVDYSSVNLMDSQSLSICVGPSLVTWPEDANALSIHADQSRTETPNVVAKFLLEHVPVLFGTLPTVLARLYVKDDEVSLSRKSKLSGEPVVENDSSDEEGGEKNNMWLRTLLRSSINEHSTSSSMFVETGSPASDKRTPSPGPPMVVPHTLVKEVPNSNIQTIHSQALQAPLSVSPEQCDLPAVPEPSPTESKTFFRFASKKSRSSKSEAGGEGKKGGRGSLRRSRKSKKEESKGSSISDLSSEDEPHKKENLFTRNTRSIREKAGKSKPHISSPLKPSVAKSAPVISVVPPPAAKSAALKSPSTPVIQVHAQPVVHPQRQLSQPISTPEPPPSPLERRGSIVGVEGGSGRVRSIREQERSEVVISREHGRGEGRDHIHKIKEHPVAKRVLVKHKSTRAAISVTHSHPEPAGSTTPTFSTRQHCTSLPEPEPAPPAGPAKEGHALVQLVSSLEKLTNPRLAPYRKFGGSIGTESGTSSNEEESVVEQESYV